jgi:hypothetical protein
MGPLLRCFLLKLVPPARHHLIEIDVPEGKEGDPRAMLDATLVGMGRGDITPHDALVIARAIEKAVKLLMPKPARKPPLKRRLERLEAALAKGAGRTEAAPADRQQPEEARAEAEPPAPAAEAAPAKAVPPAAAAPRRPTPPVNRQYFSRDAAASPLPSREREGPVASAMGG